MPWQPEPGRAPGEKAPPRHIAAGRLRNLRDLGGYRTGDGRTVRWNTLYRSDSLTKLEPTEWDELRARLGLRAVLDLRYPSEIAAKGRVPSTGGLLYQNSSVQHRPYDQTVLDSTVEPAQYLADRYAETALDGTKELREALEFIADTRCTPSVMHCSSGKDRTGIVSAIILALVGVSAADIVADYALTRLATPELVADWRAANPGRVLWQGYGQAPERTMIHFLGHLADVHGSVRAYAATLGVDDPLIAALRRQLLTA